MKVEVYESKDSVTVVCEDDDSKHTLLEDDAKLVRTIEGKDWNDCMTQHYELMGWEPYKPMATSSDG